jgi:cell volume regulation protein A
MVFDFTIMEGLLLGAIVSSTDAAAVFSILRSKGISLRGQLKPLLEFESGSNDPMAVFLTIGMIQVLTQPESSLWDMVRLFALQMSIGLAAGYVMARVTLYLVNRLKLGYEGLYPVLTLSLALLTYGLSDKLGGNGFLAVYITGIIAGNSKFIHKRSLLQFHDGLAWLMQITMFLTLGLLVFPSHLLPVMGLSLLIAVCLILVARPAGVFLSLLPSPFSFREKAFISWVGLRGAVPIILATFPFLAGILQADLLFNVVFFVVLTSVLLQGTTIQYLARWLRVDAPLHQERVYPIEFNPDSGFKSELNELIIPAGSQVVGKKLFELKLPPECLIVLIVRGNEYVLPSGQTFLNDGDALLVLADRDVFGKVVAEVNTPRPA